MVQTVTSPATPTLCVLPGGYIDEQGEVHREAELSRMSGREEELLAGIETSSATLVNQVLSHCVRRIGSVEPVTEELASSLLVGDRLYLLLRLREATFGDRVEGTLGCPWPGCGAKVDIDFAISDVPVNRSDGIAPSYSVELSPEAAVEDPHGARHRTVIFRLPNGADQEAVVPSLIENPSQALTSLLERCILRTESVWDDVTDLVARLNPRARFEIERAMEQHAPGVELEMDLNCPECGRAFTAPFDVQDFFFGEFATSQDMLYRQVHYLAYHYHWSERDVLDMPRDKRLAYIEILADEIEALNDAV